MPQSNSCFLKNRSLPFKRASPQRGGRQRQATTSAAARRGLEAFYPRLASMMEAAGCDVGSRRGRKESKYDVSFKLLSNLDYSTLLLHVIRVLH